MLATMPKRRQPHDQTTEESQEVTIRFRRRDLQRFEDMVELLGTKGIPVTRHALLLKCALTGLEQLEREFHRPSAP